MDAQAAPVTGDTPWVNPRWKYPEYPPGSVVEIRVHGVGGEGPAGMTRDPNPRNVGGDDLAGFWRARNPEVGTAGERQRRHFREVLAWGGQTSGTTRHALWVLLLPFALFNIAGRMPGGTKRAATHRSIARLLAFTLTLGVTALTAGIAFDLIGDQYAQRAWRQGSETSEGGGLLAPVKYFSDDGDGFERRNDAANDDFEGESPTRVVDDPAGRMGILALLPVIVVVGLWQAGRYRTKSLEGYPPGPDPDVVREPETLDDPDFWRNEWPVSRLRAAHASGGLGLVGVILALILADAGPFDQEHGWTVLALLSGLGVVLAAAMVALPVAAKPTPHVWLRQAQWFTRLLALGPLTAAVVIALGARIPDPVPAWACTMRVLGILTILGWAGREVFTSVADRSEGKQARPNTGIAFNLVLVAGVAAVAASYPSISEALHEGDTLARSGYVPHALSWMPDWITDWLRESAGKHLYMPAYVVLLPLVALQTVLVAALAATGVRRRFPTRTDGNDGVSSAFPWNLGAPVVALLSLLMITAVGGSLYALIIEWLGTRNASAAEGLVLPWWYALTAEVAAALLVALLLALLARMAWRKFTWPKPTPEQVSADLARGAQTPAGGGDPGNVVDARRLGAIGKGWGMRDLVRDGPHVLSWTALLALGLVVAYLVGVAWSDNADLVLPAEVPEGTAWWAELVQRSTLTTASVSLLSAATLFAVGLLRSGLRSREKRRLVAVAWDVLAFWPRVTHPFAPPCYGEAVIPMLAARIDGLVERGYKVIVAGHSQGSIVSVAAVMQMSSRDSVWLVTYGSPVAALYERAFAGTFAGPEGAIVATEGRVETWHHFFAMTEPFAVPFWKVRGADEEQLKDGWRANVLVRHYGDGCLVCGYPRPAPKDPATHTDFVVTDPAPWVPTLDPTPPAPKGHSTYHDHREVDEHLARIVP